jgi:hypothetical protein
MNCQNCLECQVHKGWKAMFCRQNQWFNQFGADKLIKNNFKNGYWTWNAAKYLSDMAQECEYYDSVYE